MEVWQQATYARRKNAADRLWDIDLRMWRWVSRGDQQRTIGRLRAEIEPKRTASAFEQCQTDDDRLRMIGCDVHLHGRKFLMSHPVQAEWLQANSYTAADAVEQYKDWIRGLVERGTLREPDWMKSD